MSTGLGVPVAVDLRSDLCLAVSAYLSARRAAVLLLLAGRSPMRVSAEGRRRPGRSRDKQRNRFEVTP